MSEMRRVVITAVLVAATVMGGTSASASLSAPRDRGTETGRAIVLVATPELPSGRSGEARERWRALRARSQTILERVAEREGLAVETRIPEIGMLSVELGPGGLPELRRRLAEDPRVESVHPDLPVELRATPNDFAFTHPDAHAPNGDLGQWNLIREGAERAWDLSKGTGAEVAMVDSGADGSHPDLVRRIVGSQGFGTSNPTFDSLGHGTHTAGLACGEANNGSGIASMGFGCSLFIAKIADGGPCSNVSQAITAAANRSSDVISMSIGGCDSSLSSALSYALVRGSVLVAAGDNRATPNPALNYPAQWVQPEGTGPSTTFDRGLVVTAAKYDGNRAGFAQRTTGVSVAAFGAASDAFSGGQQGILSSWPGNTTSIDTGGGLLGEPPCNCRTTVNGDSRYAYLVGTSMATPQVAGLAALMRAAKPSIPNTRVSRVIKATASNCGTYGSNGLGWGLIRADQAVAAALDRDITPPVSNVKSVKRARGGAAAAVRRGRIINIRVKRRDVAGQNCAGKLPVSGVKKVVVFASANGGNFHRIAKTRKAKVRFHGKPGRRYKFFSIAVDKAGNREGPPAGSADAKIRLGRR